jgi:hypothetical protein
MSETSADRYLKKMRAIGFGEEGHAKHMARMNDLLNRIKAKLPELEKLSEQLEAWEENGVYRFYHQSFKVIYCQDYVKDGLKLIMEIGGATDPPHDWFCQIVKEGTEHEFNDRTNHQWLNQTRPILEAFWHTKYFLQMMIKYGRELESAPSELPTGWAAVLWLFELR